jgi:hypothetical protein
MLQLACHRGPDRRMFLRTLLTGGAALALPNFDWLRAAPAHQPARDTAVIQIWLGGGPCHLDTYDLKPDAGDGFRSPFRPIRSNVPGLDLCELLPRQARVMDRLALIRSLHHDHNGAHVPAIHCMQTGYLVQRFTPSRPSVGAVTAKVRGANQPGLPAYVLLGTDPKHLVEAPPMFESAYLGTSCVPMKIRCDGEGETWGRLVRLSTPAIELPLDVNPTRLADRAELQQRFDRISRRVDAGGGADALDPYYRQALQLLTSARARAAFDLTREDQRVRERYGLSAWGQGALLCRRLVEAGVTFVTLNTDSSSLCWDHHEKLQPRCEQQLPVYDQMLTALLEDLVERGLYERVLVLVWAEFSRSPRFNPAGGREHWGNACFALMGGAGLKTGQVIGSTTAKGEMPKDRPLQPCDVLATVYHVLGIDPRREFHDATNRPLPILSQGEPIKELL